MNIMNINLKKKNKNEKNKNVKIKINVDIFKQYWKQSRIQISYVYGSTFFYAHIRKDIRTDN